ncbi:dirigent protein 11-like [Vigna unguiculata]|uniref:Dirigent protein n=1 Tax=Vigna unguiculata TaxID=3917 RepID=A0A4D6LQL8_VIGUN|nr:dirigent protein 11-like [Vigna unguiculata]QCD91199.1 Plant disease resistance response protein [Vigna unguiculata]
MTFAFHNYALPVFLSLLAVTGGSHLNHRNHRRERGNPAPKSLHFTLFQHETINKTGFVTVNGVEGGEGKSENSTPFGTVLVFQDPLTAKPNRSSKQLGTAEGTSITSGLDGLSSISVAKLTLRLNNHKGSISIVGGTNTLERSDYPVVGGTEDFLFVHGYVTSSPLHVNPPTLVFKIGFHLYWPPYPSQPSY